MRVAAKKGKMIPYKRGIAFDKNPSTSHRRSKGQFPNTFRSPLRGNYWIKPVKTGGKAAWLAREVLWT